MTASQTIEAIRSRSVSAEQTVRTCVERIERTHDRVNAFLYVDAGRAVRRATEIDAALARGEDPGPLAGLPIALKDNLCTTFAPTTCASRILDGFRPPYDAHVVERLEAAGAIIIGKSNLDEFAMGSSTENSAFGPTRNPWDLSRVPGGSSGGSAAVVAAGMVPAALGSDTGGSIRQPAALTGVVGLKPTYGRVSRYGLVAFASSLDQIGVFASDVQGAAIVLGVIAGHDRRDSTSVDRPVPDYAGELDQPLSASRPFRVGYAAEYFGTGLDSEVSAAVWKALEVYRELGAELIEVHLPHMKYALACYYLIATAEASSNLARYDGVHYGHRTADPRDIFELYAASRAEGFGDEVKRRIMLGTYALSSGYYDAYYVKALKVRTLVKRDFEQAFEQVDLIASPVSPTTAFRIGEKSDDPLAMYLSDVYTLGVNLAGIPGISIPCGFDSAGLPIGLQLMAPHFAEDLLLRAAHHFQLRTDHHTRSPDISP